MQIKGNTDGVNPSWPRSSLRLQREGMRKELGLEHAKQGGCSQSPGSGVSPPPAPAPPAATCRRGSARPHPRQRLLSSRGDCPSTAPPPLTSSSGVRLSRSPQQQHHLQQQHTEPLHPAIFLLSCHSGPPRPTPLPPRICASRDWPREGHVALSSFGTGDREWL